MAEDSSKKIMGNVLKMFFESYKKIYLFYTILIILQNSLPGLAVNILSAYLIILAFTSSSAILKSYNLSFKNDFSKYFILSPIISSILANLLTYLMLTIYNLDYVKILGFHVLVQSLIGLTSTILFYMFLILKGYKKKYFIQYYLLS